MCCSEPKLTSMVLSLPVNPKNPDGPYEKVQYPISPILGGSQKTLPTEIKSKFIEIQGM